MELAQIVILACDEYFLIARFIKLFVLGCGLQEPSFKVFT